VVARGLGLGTLVLAAACLAGCEPEPSIAPSVLESAKKEIATLEADLEKAEQKRNAEQERVKALLREVRAARELISGSESDAIERKHYEQVLLRQASAEVDQLVLGSPLLKTLAADRSVDAARALDAIKAIPERPFKTLVDVHKAQAALLEAIPVVLRSVKGADKDQARARAQHMREIDELRMRVSRTEDDMLRMARDFDRVRRRVQLARESLQKIAAAGDAASKAEAKRGLEASQAKK
jgi:outer membrane murein-binding lipoprotein Lpp